MVMVVATVVSRACISSCRCCDDIDGTRILSDVFLSVPGEAILSALDALMDLGRPASGAAAEFERMRQHL